MCEFFFGTFLEKMICRCAFHRKGRVSNLPKLPAPFIVNCNQVVPTVGMLTSCAWPSFSVYFITGETNQCVMYNERTIHTLNININDALIAYNGKLFKLSYLIKHMSFEPMSRSSLPGFENTCHVLWESELALCESEDLELELAYKKDSDKKESDDLTVDLRYEKIANDVKNDVDMKVAGVAKMNGSLRESDEFNISNFLRRPNHQQTYAEDPTLLRIESVESPYVNHTGVVLQLAVYVCVFQLNGKEVKERVTGPQLIPNPAYKLILSEFKRMHTIETRVITEW